MKTEFKIDDGLLSLAVPLPEAKAQLTKGAANGKYTFSFVETVKAPKGGDFPLETCPLELVDDKAMRFYEFRVTAKAMGPEAAAAKEAGIKAKKQRAAKAEAKKLPAAELRAFVEGKRAVRGFKWSEFDEAQQKDIRAALDAALGGSTSGWKTLQALTTAFCEGKMTQEEFQAAAEVFNAKARQAKAKRESEKAAKTPIVDALVELAAVGAVVAASE